MQAPQEARRPTRFGRRALLLGAGGTALLAAAGCTSFGASKPTQTVTATAPPPTDPMVSLIATTRLHLDHLTEAVRTDKRDAAKLTPLRNDRAAQLDALIKELARTSPQLAAAVQRSEASTPATAVTIPTNPDSVLEVIRGDAATAQVQFTDAVPIVSRYRAALLGSIAACMASHRAVLS